VNIMRLFCPVCGSLIPAEDMNLDKALAKCRECDNLFGFAEAANPAGAAAGRDAASVAAAAGGAGGMGGTGGDAAAILPRPPHMRIEEWGGTWRLSWRWFKWDYVGLLLFCVFWDGFLVFWYTIAFTKGGPLMMKLFPILHVAVGVSLTYTVLAGFLNRTRVEVSPGGELSVRHFPLPWVRNRRIPPGQIEQLFCEESSWRNNNRRTFHLSAALVGGGKVCLLSSFHDPGEVKFLEQQIERQLRIKPRPVVGEYRG
jgi:hypothetical protein